MTNKENGTLITCANIVRLILKLATISVSIIVSILTILSIRRKRGNALALGTLNIAKKHQRRPGLGSLLSRKRVTPKEKATQDGKAIVPGMLLSIFGSRSLRGVRQSASIAAAPIRKNTNGRTSITSIGAFLKIIFASVRLVIVSMITKTGCRLSAARVLARNQHFPLPTKAPLFLLIALLSISCIARADMLLLGAGSLPAAGGGGGVTHNATWTNSVQDGEIVIATSPTAGDTLIAWTVNDDDSAATITWPAGFTQVADIHQGGADAQTCSAAVKVNATGSEGSLSIITNGNAHIGGISAFSGAHTTTQPDVTTVTAQTNTAQASPWTQAASITPVTNGNMIAAIMCSDVTSSSDPVHTFSDTGGLTWTTRADITSGARNAAIGTASQATAAATTVTGTGTIAAVSAARVLILISVRPQ